MFKRLSAIFIALIMCLSLMTPAFAAVTADTTTSIIVKKVDSTGTDSSVVAYKIIEPSFDGVDEDTGNANGTGNFLGWKWTSAAKTALRLTTDDYITQITSDQFNTLVKALRTDASGFSSLTLKGSSDGSYSTEAATAGSYIVLIKRTNSAGMIYNPLIVSVNIEAQDVNGTVDNVLVNGSINADGDFVVNQESGVIEDTEDAGQGQTVLYAKSSPILIDKTTEDENGEEVTNGSLGDQVPYVVTTTIPIYSKNDYTTVQFTISDNLSSGLTYVIPSGKSNPIASVQYKDVNGSYQDVASDNYTITYNSGSVPSTFSIAFTSEWILKNPGVPIKVTYAATINDQAVTGFDPNTNTARLTYTNDPSTATKFVEDEYREYTFSINGNITEQNIEDITKIQTNIVKTGENEEKTDTTSSFTYGPVKDAGFTLYSDNNGQPGDEIREEVFTDEKGLFTFEHLGEGTYWIVETTAPKGYALNSIPVKVEIKANVTNDILESYTITINGTNTSTYEATYSSSSETLVLEDVTVTENPYEFINTTISSLPSTGSYGTYAFILIGCVIMATALTMFVVKRKESK